MVKKINIAYIIDQLGTGGTERQLKLLIDNLDQNKFEASLFLLRGEKKHPLKPDNAKIHLLNINSLISFDGLLKLYKLSRLLKKRKFQIVQTFFQDSAIAGVLAGKMAGVKRIVVSVRDMLFWAKPVSLRVYQIAMKMSDRILVNSKSVKEKIRPLCGNKRIQIIYNGIFTGKEFQKNKKAKDALKEEFNIGNLPIVVLVSNCNRKVKRVDLLIECIPHVIENIPAFFLIVGDGWMRPFFEERVTELKFGKYVKFTGLRNDVENILAGADMALNTSDSEGFSNSVMEAMRAGLPVIATDVSGNKELVQDGITGLLFKQGDVDDLRVKILSLLKNREFADKLGENGKLSIEKRFDVNIIMQQYMNLYESLIDLR
ncbi:MAG: glycosyltransferase [Bacteroidales bacterium]|nr:glycosyltransferase [Bacteroidales bacterium]